MAKKKRHSETEITAKLQHANALAAEGRSQSEIANALGISIMTLHRWRKAAPERSSEAARFPVNSAAHPDGSDRRRVEELQTENARLRRLVTDLLLEKMRLEEEVQRSDPRLAGRKRLP